LKRIISVVGARPNFMKVAPIHRAFLERPTEFDHQIVHTGQHYDASMSDAFFHDLDMPYPQWFLGVGSGSHAQQTARIISAFEEVCVEARPDYVIVVGDVNSTIACALTSVKIGIRTAHIESGLRSFDRSMPEEINRLATDAIVNDLFVTEPSGMHNLHHEGVEAERIHFVGNTMIDSLHYALDRAQDSDVLSRLNVIPQEYALVTLHRPSNVDFEARLTMLMSTLAAIASDTTLVFPMHPRTRKNMSKWNVAIPDNVIVIDPVGYIDFVTLMRDAAFTLTDSGGIQEETTALGVPCITARTSTERPSTTDIGTNVLVLPERQPILDAVNDIRNGKRRQGRVPELWDGRAALRIVEVISRKLS
jgi:UDP-N-acetylglucosamine 2-epimerase (non-hydrolysing)